MAEGHVAWARRGQVGRGYGGMLSWENVCIRILRDAFPSFPAGTLFSYFLLTTFGTFCNLFSGFEHKKMVKNMCSSINKKKISVIFTEILTWNHTGGVDCLRRSLPCLKPEEGRCLREVWAQLSRIQYGGYVQTKWLFVVLWAD